YYQAARFFGKPEIIVRVTSDCPLIDPEILDQTIDFFLNNDFDYASTGRIQSTFPDGLDTEIFKFSALEKAWREAKLPSEREHVTPYIWKNPELFRLGELKNSEDLSHLRWTVDEERDLEFVRAVFRRLYQTGKIFHLRDVLDLLKKNPELTEKNKSIVRDAGYFKSLKEDQK
ncbi:MAG: spore coat protein, partial [Candidatus Nealsonbacteria bacterium]|nr:spore coat protein [Candidatus Nealsonbacteria bacterium]